jgi:hypothetical protein
MAEFKGIDLSLLTDPQLLHLLKRVEVEIAIRRAAGKRLVSEALREGDGPRYRNPDNATETWSGRGKMPAWVQQALEGGASLAELEIVDNRPVRGSRRR